MKEEEEDAKDGDDKEDEHVEGEGEGEKDHRQDVLDDWQDEDVQVTVALLLLTHRNLSREDNTQTQIETISPRLFFKSPFFPIFLLTHPSQNTHKHLIQRGQMCKYWQLSLAESADTSGAAGDSVFLPFFLDLIFVCALSKSLERTK